MRFILLRNAMWMGWNVALALVPLALSFVLFRAPWHRRSVLWWLGLLLFLAFLPNAPYVLTDIVHLTRDVSAAAATGSDTAINAVLAQYALLFAIGFGAYAWFAGGGQAPLPATPLRDSTRRALGSGRQSRPFAGELPRSNGPTSVSAIDARLAASTFFVLAIGTAVLHAFAWGLSLAGRSVVRVRRL